MDFYYNVFKTYDFRRLEEPCYTGGIILTRVLLLNSCSSCKKQEAQMSAISCVVFVHHSFIHYQETCHNIS
jgi:hypothetical protein